MNQDLIEHIQNAVIDGKTLSLERGKGTTYHNGNPTLYALGTYPRSSVLAGQQSREFLESWESFEQAKSDLDREGFSYDDLYEIGGTSLIPLEEMLAHLPKEEGEQ